MTFYIPPTEADVLARFPEFDSVMASVLIAVLDEAQAEVGDAWPNGSRFTATIYLTAHLLAVEGGVTRSAATNAAGPLTGYKEGGIDYTYADTSGADTTGEGYARTSYGRRYREIRRRTFAGAMFTV